MLEMFSSVHYVTHSLLKKRFIKLILSFIEISYTVCAT
jgi:hypothetical protein